MKIISNYSIGNIYNRINLNKPNFCAKYPQINEDYFEKEKDDPKLYNSLKEIYKGNSDDLDMINCKNVDDIYTINFEIEDKTYRFIDCCSNKAISAHNVYDKYKNIAQMVDNIRKTTMGRFVRDGNREVFVPYILGRTPDVKRDEILVKNGNASNNYYEDFDDIREELECILDRNIERDEMTTINYLNKTVRGFDNNEVKQAYGYTDNEDGTTYLYIPDRNKLQTLLDNGYVKSYYLE